METNTKPTIKTTLGWCLDAKKAAAYGHPQTAEKLHRACRVHVLTSTTEQHLWCVCECHTTQIPDEKQPDPNNVVDLTLPVLFFDDWSKSVEGVRDDDPTWLVQVLRRPKRVVRVRMSAAALNDIQAHARMYADNKEYGLGLMFSARATLDRINQKKPNPNR